MRSTTEKVTASLTIPPPWDYNPSAWSQRVPVAILAVVGFLIAGYMALFQWGQVASVWDPVFGEQSSKVLTSPVAKRMDSWFHIPDAALGAFAYLGDAVFALAGSIRRWKCRPWLVILFGIDVIPLGIVSVILVILQGTVVGYWCFLCLITAVVSLVLIVFAYDEVWSCLLYLWEVWKTHRSVSLLWRTFWGQGSREAYEVAVAFAGRRQAVATRG